MLPSFYSTYEGLAASDPRGHLLLAQFGALAAFLQKTPQNIMPR